MKRPGSDGAVRLDPNGQFTSGAVGTMNGAVSVLGHGSK